jgi:hypothetical protein
MKLSSSASIAFSAAGVLSGSALLAATPALAAGAAPSAVTVGTRANASPATWRSVALPSSVKSPAALADVSASSKTNAWAVGTEAETSFDQGTPLILHWNGTKWSTVALSGVPGPGFLTSVSAASASDAWAAGSDKSGAVVLRWNGIRWSNVSFPDKSLATVSSVAVAPNGTAWLAGSVASDDGQTLVEEWDGSAWHVVKTGLGAGSLDSVRVSASGDVWVGGGNSNQSVVGHEHRGTWTALPAPGMITASDILAAASSDVWAVGYTFSTPGGATNPAVCHWNGSTWKLVNAPAKMVGQALTVSPGATGQPQWLGVEDLGSPSATQYAYYNGTAWSSVTGATALPGILGANTATAHIPGTNSTWAVGNSYTMDSALNILPGQAFIEYNP